METTLVGFYFTCLKLFQQAEQNAMLLGETLGHYRDISTGVQLNGSLILDSVRQEDQGQYLCEASNGIGEGLSSVVTLTVNGTS